MSSARHYAAAAEYIAGGSTTSSSSTKRPSAVKLVNKDRADFCIDVRSHALAELGYVTTKYNNTRPSVIYFHGSLTTTKSAASTTNHPESPELLTKKGYSHTEGMDAIPDFKETNGGYAEDKELLDNVAQQDLSSRDQEENEQCRCKKRHRTSFSSMQLKRLEEEFDGDNYIIGMKRWRLSEELDIPEKQIKIWFQNRRTKSKKSYSKNYCRSPNIAASIIYEDGDDF